jgi:hypothetical protein
VVFLKVHTKFAYNEGAVGIVAPDKFQELLEGGYVKPLKAKKPEKKILGLFKDKSKSNEA